MELRYDHHEGSSPLLTGRVNKMKTTSASPPLRFYRTLHFQVFAGIILGIALGSFYPSAGEAMKPIGDGFINLIRMMIAPIIFFTVVVGIASVGDMRKVGRVGLKALLYFEVVTSLALLIGLIVVTVVQPGAGINANPATLDAKAVQQYTTSAKGMHAVDFVLNIIPDTVVNAFAKGEILQVLLVAILFGLALSTFEQGRPIVAMCDAISQVLFRVIAIIMMVAPLGAFGAMAFTIGKYGLKALLPLGKLVLCVYLTSALFVFVRVGPDRAPERLQSVEVAAVPRNRDLPRARDFFLRNRSAAADLKVGALGLFEIRGWIGGAVGLFIQSGRNLDLSDHRRAFRGTSDQHAPQRRSTGYFTGGPDADLKRRGSGDRWRIHHSCGHALFPRNGSGGGDHPPAGGRPLHVPNAISYQSDR